MGFHIVFHICWLLSNKVNFHLNPKYCISRNCQTANTSNKKSQLNTSSKTWRKWCTLYIAADWSDMNRGKVFKAVWWLFTTRRSTCSWTFIVLQFLLDHKKRRHHPAKCAGFKRCTVHAGLDLWAAPSFKDDLYSQIAQTTFLPCYSKQQAPSSSCQQVLFQWTGCPGML